MRTIKIYFSLAILGLFLVSCINTNEDKTKEKQEEVKTLSAKLTNVEVKIEGMTCEIGCARLIQSKLHKTEGVKFVNVNFEEEKGEITFDANQISDSELKKIIEDIAGGDLYKVVQVEKVSEFKKVDEKVDI